MSSSNDEQLSYRRHAAIESQFSSPIERGPAYNKYLLSAYLFFRSRLCVPGRAYDSEDAGMIAIGGSAHCDIIDLETFLSAQADQDRQVAYYWMLDSSLDEVAVLRRSRGYSRPTMTRKREELVARAADSMAAAA